MRWFDKVHVEVRRNVRASVLIFSLGGVVDHCGTLVLVRRRS